MKKILTVIFLSIVVVSVHGQSMALLNEDEDSTIAVIGYFCKNDTMEYQRVHGKIKIMDNDTIMQGEITERFMVVVTDSTSEGYQMEIIPVSCEVQDSANDYQTRMAYQLWKDIKDLRCRFTTDEFGSVKHIENWREIRDVLKKGYVNVFDNLYKTMPQMDSIMPRNQIESLVLLGCSTEDGIKEHYDELDMLFGFHGSEITMDPVESDDVSEAGYPMHTRIESYYPAQESEYDLEGDYVVQVHTETQMSNDDASDLINTTMGTLFTGELTDSVNKYTKEALTDKNMGITISNHSRYSYFFNGWPKEIQKITETNMSGLFRRIEYDILDWTSHKWSY